MSDFELIVHGCRGSAAVAGSEKARYGGNTTCFQVDVGDPAKIILVDAGTGLRRLQHALDTPTGLDFHIFLTHLHWDHIQGLPFFEPLFTPGNSITFYAERDPAITESDLREAIRPPFFPVSLDEAAAKLEFKALVGEVCGLSVSTTPLRHPQGSTAYRFETAEKAVVVATDHEAGNEGIDRGLVELAREADLLVHDAQYLPEEYLANRKGWGHSTWEAAVAAAVAADVGRLVLSSHDPDRTDEEVESIVAAARRRFPSTDGAKPGVCLC